MILIRASSSCQRIHSRKKESVGQIAMPSSGFLIKLFDPYHFPLATYNLKFDKLFNNRITSFYLYYLMIRNFVIS